MATKKIQLKDGNNNLLYPKTYTDLVVTTRGSNEESIYDTAFAIKSNSVLTMDMTWMEQGTMSINANGTYSKGAATSGFVRLKKSAMHLQAGTVIKIAASGVQMYIGGMYDDNTPITPRSWILRYGGTYYCDKDGMYAVIMRYVGSPAFNGTTYTAEDLSAHMSVVGSDFMKETVISLAYNDRFNVLMGKNGLTLDMNCLEISGLVINNDGTATKYPQQVNRMCPITTYFHLSEGTIIKAESNAQLMIGGHMDDGTFFKAVTFQISGSDGGAFLCAKTGYYYFVARYNGQPDINSSGYPQDGLAKKIHIIPPSLQKDKSEYPIRCVAHQGISNNVSFSQYGNCRVSSYKTAAIAGFTDGECDIQFTSDGVAVCCHDASFTDSSSGTTYVIADNTIDVLKAATYYGEKIATFDEVVAVCKQNNLGLYIDRVENINTDAKWEHVLGIIKKYCYEDKVRWLAFNSKIIQFYAKSKFSLIPSSNAVATVVDMLTNYHSQYPNAEFTANVNFTYATLANVQSMNSQIPAGTGIEVYTVDTYSTYKSYMPYVAGITTNKYSLAML